MELPHLHKERIFCSKDLSCFLERAKGVEPSTFSLATRRSTTELCPHLFLLINFSKRFLHFRTQLVKLNYPTETRTNQESCGSTVSQNLSQTGTRWISNLGTDYLFYSLSSRRL